MNGCLLAILIVGGIVVVIALVMGFVAYRFATSPDGKKLVAAVSSGAALVAEATNAPGTTELRALGCSTPMVIDAEKIAAIAQAFGDAGTAKVEGDEGLAVVCGMNGGKPPTCDEVAETYVKAVGGTASASFAVSVGQSGGNPQCQGNYLANGKRAPSSGAHEGTHEAPSHGGTTHEGPAHGTTHGTNKPEGH
jgi:hypothetical protein